MQETDATLTESDPRFLVALKAAFCNTEYQIDVYNTGGGCMVARLFGVSEDGGEIWLSRDGYEWLVGFYNFAQDEEDEGVCLNLTGFSRSATDVAHGMSANSADDAWWVANQIHGMLVRL